MKKQWYQGNKTHRDKYVNVLDFYKNLSFKTFCTMNNTANLEFYDTREFSYRKVLIK